MVADFSGIVAEISRPLQNKNTLKMQGKSSLDSTKPDQTSVTGNEEEGLADTQAASLSPPFAAEKTAPEKKSSPPPSEVSAGNTGKKLCLNK
jgi:hypothetical protein